MNILFFICSFLALQMICLIVGKKTSKTIANQNDYYLAGKSIGFFPLMMTFVATQVGGGLILGSSEEAYQYGWAMVVYPFGVSLGLIALALGIGKKMAEIDVSTVPELFEFVYGSQFLRRAASLMSIFSLFLIFVAQIIASKKFMLSLGLDNELLFIFFWAIVILYTVMGGLKAVVATDVVQASFFIVVFIAGFLFTCFQYPEVIYQVTSFQPHADQGFDFDANKLANWMLMPLLFMLIEQDMGQRCFAARSPQIVSKAVGMAAVITIGLCLIPVFFGVAAKTLNLVIPPGASVLMSAIQALTSPEMAAIVGCAVFCAIISTADSLINAISANLSQDFNLSASKKVSIAKATTWAIGMGGILCSALFNNIVDLLMLSYELSVYCFFVPIFLSILNPVKRHSLPAFVSIGVGLFGFIVFKIFPGILFKEGIIVGSSFFSYALTTFVINRQVISQSAR